MNTLQDRKNGPPTDPRSACRSHRQGYERGRREGGSRATGSSRPCPCQVRVAAEVTGNTGTPEIPPSRPRSETKKQHGRLDTGQGARETPAPQGHGDGHREGAEPARGHALLCYEAGHRPCASKASRKQQPEAGGCRGRRRRRSPGPPPGAAAARPGVREAGLGCGRPAGARSPQGLRCPLLRGTFSAGGLGPEASQGVSAGPEGKGRQEPSEGRAEKRRARGRPGQSGRGLCARPPPETLGPPAPPEVQAAGERVHGTEGGPGARGQGCTGWAIPSPWAGSAKPSHALHSGQRAPARDPRARLRTGAPPRADGREPPASRCERPRPREATHTGALSCWRRTSRRLRSRGAVRPGPASLAAPRPLCRPAEDLQADPRPTQFLCNLAGQAEGAGNHTVTPVNACQENAPELQVTPTSNDARKHDCGPTGVLTVTRGRGRRGDLSEHSARGPRLGAAPGRPWTIGS